jgi:hypothetical protein
MTPGVRLLKRHERAPRIAERYSYLIFDFSGHRSGGSIRLEHSYSKEGHAEVHGDRYGDRKKDSRIYRRGTRHDEDRVEEIKADTRGGAASKEDDERAVLGSHRFRTRYATLGFNDKANLDDGRMWPTAFALLELTPAEEARIISLVKNAVSD